MNLYIIGHSYNYELEKLLRLFYPNEKIVVTNNLDEIKKPYVYTRLDGKLYASAEINGYFGELSSPLRETDGDNEIALAQAVFKLLTECTGIKQPWGLLTGVRPIKLFRSLADAYGEETAKSEFKNRLFVSDEKITLASETEKNERDILRLSKRNSFSLYVGIPFCPSRCSYCSFVMSSVEKTKKLVQPYVELLCEELKRTAEIADSLNLRLETVYFGGGTPTTLSAEQLNRVIGTVSSCFDLSPCREFTVEAGRPDTVDDEKLIVLKENNVDRISINPQTLSDEILWKIGRRHTAAQFFDAFSLAGKAGFKNINVDLIAGLPTDTARGFKVSLDGVLSLSPECITVHTLCMKRSSDLTAEGAAVDKSSAESVAKMLKYSEAALFGRDYIPYYLYRQSRMAGNLENVGWSKMGHEGLYNVYAMDETHTVLSVGAGAVTKLRDSDSGLIERIFNYKYPYEYIGDFAELIKRKEKIIEFYGKIAVE